MALEKTKVMASTRACLIGISKWEENALITDQPDRCNGQLTQEVALPNPPLPPQATGPQRNRYLFAEQPAPAQHIAHLEGCAALRIVLVTVPTGPQHHSIQGSGKATWVREQQMPSAP